MIRINNYMKLLLVYIFLLSINSGCSQRVTLAKLPYDLYNPTHTYKLGEKLKEISGLTYLNDRHIAGIQDEDGFVFILNFIKGKITNRIKFEKDGDYTSIEMMAPCLKSRILTQTNRKPRNTKQVCQKRTILKDYAMMSKRIVC